MSERLLPQGCLLLGCGHALAKALLANCRQLLASTCQGGTIGLPCRKLLPLLLLCGLERLPVALVHQAGHGLPAGQFLLAR